MEEYEYLDHRLELDAVLMMSTRRDKVDVNFWGRCYSQSYILTTLLHRKGLYEAHT